MSRLIEIERLRHTAADTGARLLDGISLAIEAGERVGVIGPSGSGKTTLCYHLAGVEAQALVGRSEGDIRRAASVGTRRGLVLQNPENQLFSSTVGEEVAFGLEDDAGDVASRALAAVGLDGFTGRPLRTLSLGEKQRVILASFLARRSELLLLDEPTNSLDGAGADRLFALLRELPGTLIVVEHDVERLADWADRILELSAGQLVGGGTPAEWLPRSVYAPGGYRVALALARRDGLPSPPAVPGELRQWAGRVRGQVRPLGLPSRREAPGPEVLRVESLTGGYPGRPEVLRGLTLSLRQGEVVALLGSNGSGKTTLLRHVSALLRPRRGSVRLGGVALDGKRPEALFGRLALLFQNPDYQIFAGTVREECAFALGNAGIPAPEARRRVEESLEAVGLTGLAGRNPLTLSYGEKRRLTLASVLVARPAVLALDEPTTALDAAAVAAVRSLLLRLAREQGTAILVATHDLDFALDVADRIAVVADGAVVRDLPLPRLHAADLVSAGFTLPLAAEVAVRTGLCSRPLGQHRLLEALATEERSAARAGAGTAVWDSSPHPRGP